MATVGFTGADHCTGDAVEHIAADSDRSVVRCCRDAFDRHFMIVAQLSDIQGECQHHTCTGQTSSCSTCLQVQYKMSCDNILVLAASVEFTFDTIG